MSRERVCVREGSERASIRERRRASELSVLLWTARKRFESNVDHRDGDEDRDSNEMLYVRERSQQEAVNLGPDLWAVSGREWS